MTALHPSKIIDELQKAIDRGHTITLRKDKNVTGYSVKFEDEEQVHFLANESLESGLLLMIDNYDS